jgi:hypothetical protein
LRSFEEMLEFSGGEEGCVAKRFAEEREEEKKAGKGEQARSQ